MIPAVPSSASRWLQAAARRSIEAFVVAAALGLTHASVAQAQARRPVEPVVKPAPGQANAARSAVQEAGGQRKAAQRTGTDRVQGAPTRSAGAVPVVSAAAARRAGSAQNRAASAPAVRPVRALPVIAAGATASSVVAIPTIGRAIGLHHVADPLALRSSVALVMDQQTGQIVYQKNSQAVLPIASITKLMTAMVVLDSGAPLNESLQVTEADRDTERHSSSRLPIGSQVSRSDMLLLALMSSENRAAHALGRLHPEGLGAFVTAMNAKARALGLTDTRFTEPTGLSGGNVSSARDLARLAAAAHAYPLIREYSTANGRMVDIGRRQVGYRSTNRLVDHPQWDIGLQKTGFISEAGKCLVMQATVDGRDVIIVLLDAQGSQSRFADAERLRRWLTESAGQGPSTTQGPSASGPDAVVVQRAWPS